MPSPYTVPCCKDTFQELYYWDTFYTNEGLLAMGEIELARGNTDNILSLIERFGFMPNGNRDKYLDRSQPPHAALMVKRLFDVTGDVAWLERCLPILEREYDFWMTKRGTPIGLNRYGHHADKERLAAYRWDDRMALEHGLSDENAHLSQNAHNLAECESGWDFCPRFDRRCRDFCPVDLNSLLFAHEWTLAGFCQRLGQREAAMRWQEFARVRRERMRRYLWSERRQAYLDYDYRRGALSPVLSAAVFYPVWLGLDKPSASTVAGWVRALESSHALNACEAGPRSQHYQWDAPNAWPPLQYVAVHACLAVGLEEEAGRLARQYLDIVAANFVRTGDLWEKYNAQTGNTDAQNEYEMPAMMGWTAGVFAALALPDSPAGYAGSFFC
jgi:alpha,alpha-trehalase